MATPRCLLLGDILRHSSPKYIPLVRFVKVRDEGQRPETMHDAYVVLVKLVSRHRRVEQLERTYTYVHEALQDKRHLQEGCRWHAKVLHRLMHQVQQTIVYAVLKAWSGLGHLLRDHA